MSLAPRFAASVSFVWSATSFSLAALAVGALGCSASRSDPAVMDRAGTTSEAIINGTTSDATQDAVVLLANAEQGYTCTATLVAPNLILTARHCVSPTADGGFSCDVHGVGSAGGAVQGDYTASTLFVYVGAQKPTNPHAFAARGKSIYHDAATNLCNHDLALVLLDRDVANASIAPLRLDDSPRAGETFTAVGWGVTTTTEDPATRQQRKNVAIKDVGPASDFDVGDVPPNEFAIGEASCEGDSGGPALDSKTGAILGVVSRGGNGLDPGDAGIAASCQGNGEVNYYTEVAPFKSVVLKAFADSGHDPWLEGQPDPRLAKDGEACTANTDCQSGACNTAAGTCAQSCAQSACPDGFDCNAQSMCVARSGNAATGGSSGCAIAREGRGDGGARDGAWLGVAVAAVVFAGSRRRRRG